MAALGRLVMVGLLVVFGAGCASTRSDRVAFNAEAHADVRRILVLQSAQPAEVLARPPHMVVVGWGLVTAILLSPASAAINIDNQRKTSDFAALAAGRGVDPGDLLASGIADRLSKSGYAVIRRRVEQAPSNWPDDPRGQACANVRWTGIDPAWRGDADAVLEIRMLPTGFAKFNPWSGPYGLYAGACVRVVELRSLAIVYRDSLTFHGGGLLGAGTFLRHESDAGFADYDELVEKRESAFASVRQAMIALAEQVALDLSASQR